MRCDTQTFLRQSYLSSDIRITHAGMHVEVQTPTNTMHGKKSHYHNQHTIQEQLNVPLHEDSMTNSSESSEDDQVLFDIMESHDDNHNNIVCLFSMFVMECYDKDEVQYEYEHKWAESPLGRRKKIERDFQGSFEKLEKQYFNGESLT